MVIHSDIGNCFDFFPIIFIILGAIGLGMAIFALIKWRNVENNQRKLVVVLSVITMLLFVGALVCGIIGATDVECITYEYGKIHNSEYITACSWVCLGLGIGAFVCGVGAFVLQLLTKNIIAVEKDVKIVNPVVEEDTGDTLFYQEFSEGAIEVKEDYIIYYQNILPMSWCKKGRTSSIVFFNDIQHITYKGSGWFKGVLAFTFKHFNKPLVIYFSKWFFWRSQKLNPKMTPIYEYIKAKVIKNNK